MMAAACPARSEAEMWAQSSPRENRLVPVLLCWFNWEQAEVYANEH